MYRTTYKISDQPPDGHTDIQTHRQARKQIDRQTPSEPENGYEHLLKCLDNYLERIKDMLLYTNLCESSKSLYIQTYIRMHTCRHACIRTRTDHQDRCKTCNNTYGINENLSAARAFGKHEWLAREISGKMPDTWDPEPHSRQFVWQMPTAVLLSISQAII